jgi:hypothetical protein
MHPSLLLLCISPLACNCCAKIPCGSVTKHDWTVGRSFVRRKREGEEEEEEEEGEGNMAERRDAMSM